MTLSKLNKEIKKLEKQLNPLYTERNKIKHDVSMKSKLKEIGTCYKFKNSYGSGISWMGFLKIIGITDYGFTVLQFQEKEENDIEIIVTERYSDVFYDNFYKRISEKKFSKEFTKIQRKINDKNKA